MCRPQARALPTASRCQSHGGITRAQVSVEEEDWEPPNTSSANVSHCPVEAPHTRCPHVLLAPTLCSHPPGDAL